MTSGKTLYLANPYGFSSQQREGPLTALVAALEALGAEVWEPFARNNQIDRASPGWAYRIWQADLRDVRDADGLFAVVNGAQSLKTMLEAFVDEVIAMKTQGPPPHHVVAPDTIVKLQQFKLTIGQLFKE